MISPLPSKCAPWKVWAVVGWLLLGCSGGENKPILVDRITASLSQDPVPPGEPVVFFDNVEAFQDTLTMDVVIRDTSGSLEADEVSLVFWYDATFLQVLSVSSVNTPSDPTLFGTSCGAVDADCGIASPICISNRAAANAGGSAFCRSNSTTPCVADDDCPGVNDICGSFGTLEASFVVVTGNEVCENDPGVSCTTDSDCTVCSNDTSRSCVDASDCRICSQDPSQTCTIDADCGVGNTCQVGTCDGNCLGTGCGARSCVMDADCGASFVCQGGVCFPQGTVRIATVALRVTDAGMGEFRFVVSSNAGAVGSLLRENGITNQGVLFYPTIDVTTPANPTTSGMITILGTL